MSDLSADPRNDDAAQVPQTLGALLANVSSELIDAAETLRKLQGLLAGIGSRTFSAADMVGLQSLDTVEQAIRALGNIVAAASARTGAGVIIDADSVMADCRMSTLAARLSNQQVEIVETVEFF